MINLCVCNQFNYSIILILWIISILLLWITKMFISKNIETGIESAVMGSH